MPAAIDNPHCSAGDIEDHRSRKVHELAAHPNKDSDSETESTSIEIMNEGYRGEGVTGLMQTLPPATGNGWGCHRCLTWNDAVTAPEFCAKCHHRRYSKCKQQPKLATGVEEEI